MRAKDLMIGDWVYNSKNEKCKVCGTSEIFDSNITLDNYDKEDDGCFETEFEVSPIPLTSEILEANDIHREGGVSHWCDETHSLAFFFWNEDRIEMLASRNGDRHPYILKLDVKYIHQVQHAFALCGIRKAIQL